MSPLGSRRARRVLGIAASVLLAATASAAPPKAAPGLVATRALVERLTAAGRGEAAVTLKRTDPLGGPPQVEKGRIALEPPARVRLDFPASGERVAVRADGGEWVQPATQQMLRLTRQRTEAAAGLWQVLLRGGAERFRERSSGSRRCVLEAKPDSGSGIPDRITVELDARGLPTAIEMDDGSGSTTRYEFLGWRFSGPKGDRAFTLAAPRGYAVVDMP
jgi:outer membrane lipoprotein-sorting protein